MVDLGKDRSRVALRGAHAALLVLAVVAAGGVLGLLLDPVAAWAAAQGWLPFQGVLDQVDRFAGWAPVWGQLLAGGVVGAGVGLLLVDQATVVLVRETVDGDVAELRAALRTHGWPVRG